MAGGPYNYNYIFKYIIIGDMGVGKSCLLHQFTEKKCKWALWESSEYDTVSLFVLHLNILCIDELEIIYCMCHN